MGIDRAFSDSEPVGRRSRTGDLRPDTHNGVLGIGTLACPICDAPVAPGPGPMSPADAIGCPLCGHGAAVRDFLSLAAPSRPARVEVRVVHRPRSWRVRARRR
ncbi:hypothetical protein PAI11_08880 [Patulibacter medicamentivorans]|uniref:Uncharacterized protein n=1 Tax=Patulibacter medicamentivorans TaxID=1097667 RepID=H0E275_9ACTN|nr:hypothetical protein [Patulibacter medicamentivorans]EHN12212.1 hypothetical protein PAI11_08880 [Patulibacter medicamentivorans]